MHRSGRAWEGAPMVTGNVVFTLNGAPVEVPADGCSLLEALRDRLGLRSAKDGCSPQGQCGCCTVWVDGQPRVACVTPVARVSGRAVTTVEGLADAAEWGQRFCAAGASQCGFCTPGQLMAAVGLLKDNPHPSREEARQAMSGNLCRCGNYDNYLNGVMRVAGSNS